MTKNNCITTTQNMKIEKEIERLHTIMMFSLDMNQNEGWIGFQKVFNCPPNGGGAVLVFVNGNGSRVVVVRYFGCHVNSRASKLSQLEIMWWRNEADAVKMRPPLPPYNHHVRCKIEK